MELCSRLRIVWAKTTLKGVRMERAEHVLDVAYNSSGNPNENNSGGSSSSDNNGQAGL